MGRLFAGTAWDRPPKCNRCGKLEAECTCAPAVVETKLTPPESQTARLRLEKRPKGKHVTTVSCLDPKGNELTALAARLKEMCGTGGTVKNGVIELQGDHLDAAESALRELAYKTRRG
jgi:translation initiation factor 1